MVIQQMLLGVGGATPNVDASGGTISEVGSKTIHQ